MNNILTYRNKILYEISKITISILRNLPHVISDTTELYESYFKIQCIKGNDKFHNHLIINSFKGKIIQLTSPVARRSEYMSEYDNHDKSFNICANYAKREIEFDITDDNANTTTLVSNDIPDLHRPDIEEYIFQQSLVDNMIEHKLLLASIEPLLKNSEELLFREGGWESTDEELLNLLNSLKEEYHEFIF